MPENALKVTDDEKSGFWVSSKYAFRRRFQSEYAYYIVNIVNILLIFFPFDAEKQPHIRFYTFLLLKIT